MKDALGDRIKSQYEDRTRFFLPRRTYTIIRVDGKAFHTLTRGCQKPFDGNLMHLMDMVAVELCKEIQGTVLAYVQSDEISILLTDFATPTTNAWFDGNIQKMASIAASAATAAFNDLGRHMFQKRAMFDARVFTVPDRIEVENYFIWRQADATRNSLQMAARAVYSHKELDGKSCANLHDMLHAKGINWNNYNSGQKRGRCVVKREINMASEFSGHQVGQARPPENIMRRKWVVLGGDLQSQDKFEETPIFTQDRSFLRNLIPAFPEVNFVPTPVKVPEGFGAT